MLITYHANTNQLSPSSRIVIDHDATLDPATTVMFCKINEQKLRTMIFRNDGTIIKTPQTPKTLIKKLLDFPRSWDDAPSGMLGLLKQIPDSQGKPVPLHGRYSGTRH